MGYVLVSLLCLPAVAAALLVLGIATGLFRERTQLEQTARSYRTSWLDAHRAS
jgi:hypothetical protein